ncbi:uncharacterized protein LOC62_06G008373 [Vanrija pseudolonga]|uniref:Uncharacterized protein n=1 Tax=Vanrija pseudolonga TaxID=143232 RepID=A0AAF0YGY1_9TREE|nr:hypothetical protein LOC62_06G008373 [Vanrija pseudolonga]
MSRRTPPPASTIDDLLHPSPDAGPSRRTAWPARQRLLSSASSASTPPRARTPAMLPPSPPRLSRANSANGGGTRDQWHVTNGTGPLTSIEGTTAPGKVAGVDGEPSLTLRGAAGADDPSSRPPALPTSRSWGGGLVSTAVNAAVFGAAVGLTAYRIWSDWGRPDDSGGPPPESPTVSSHDLPPAYESLADSSVRSHPHSYGGHRDSSSRSSMSPTTRSTASTPVKRYRPARMRRKRPQRPSIADLVAVASTSASPLRPERVSASSASVSVASGTTAPTAPDSLSVTRETPDLSVRSDADEDEEDEEMNARLDVMAQRLQGLITEGRRALDSTPIIEETSPSPDGIRGFKGLEVEQGGEEPDVVEGNEDASQAPDTDTGSEAVEILRDGSSTLPAPSGMSGASRSSSSASLARSSTSGSLARRSQRSVSQGSTPNSSVRGIATVCPVPPLPWSKVHKGPAPSWVQRPFNAKDSPAPSPERPGDPSKPGAVSLEPSKPGAVAVAPPDRNGTVTPPPQPQPPRPESVTSPTSRASRIPRPGGGHSRTSSTSTGVSTRPEAASPVPSVRRQSSRQSTRPQSTTTTLPQSPKSAPAPPQRKMHRSSSIKDAIASLERSAAAAAIPVSSSPQLTPSQRSKIPIRRSIGGGPLSPPLPPPPAEATDAAPQPPLPTPTVK